MAGQPLNTGIKIYRTLRSQRADVRHESVKALTGNLRAMEMQVAGDERPQVYAVNVDAATKGITSYDKSGRPLVVGVKAVKAWDLYSKLTGVDFPTTIGNDQFIANTAAGLASDTAGADLQSQSRTVS